MVAAITKCVHIVAERECSESCLEIAIAVLVVIAVVPGIDRTGARCSFRVSVVDVDSRNCGRTAFSCVNTASSILWTRLSTCVREALTRCIAIFSYEKRC